MTTESTISEQRDKRTIYTSIHKWLIIWQNGFAWSLYFISNSNNSHFHIPITITHGVTYYTLRLHINNLTNCVILSLLLLFKLSPSSVIYTRVQSKQIECRKYKKNSFRLRNKLAVYFCILLWRNSKL